jgi:protein-disulfide isomerase
MAEEIKKKKEKEEIKDENIDEIEDCCNKKDRNKKIKNLISAVIILAGLFVGSLFVDAAQMIRGAGFSPRALNQADIFENNGKTWVSYTEPIVKVQVINDDACKNCDATQALVWLKRIVPTILTEKVDAASDQGKALAENLGIKYLPAFVFSTSVEQTDFYAQASTLFNKKNDSYVLDTAQLGLEPGEYLSSPSIGADDIKIGSDDAKVKLFEFSDFQCPYCKQFSATVDKILKDYGDKVQLIFKPFPLSIHAQANDSALAAECANEQEKFLEYNDKLFAMQSDWGNSTDIQKFKTYAVQMGMNADQFNKCLDDKKYQDAVNASLAEGKSFGIAGTPAMFVNAQFKNGVVGYDDLKTAIDQELQK